MVRVDHLNGTAAGVLAWLWDLDTRGGGYTRRGVRGWARREDVEVGMRQRLPEVLPRLRDRGLVAEDDLHVPGTRPVAVYRITGLGDLLLARHQGREPRPPWPAGEPGEEDQAVFLPAGSSLALSLLREALSDPRPSRHPGLGIGWRSEAELRDQLEARSESRDGLDTGPWLPGDPPWQASGVLHDDLRPEPSPGFDALDLAWLERAGLVQRSSVNVARRTRPVTLWRITDAGAELTEVQWHEPRDP